MEELLLRLLSSLDFSSGARWLEAVKKHRHTSRVAKRRRVTSILGGYWEAGDLGGAEHQEWITVKIPVGCSGFLNIFCGLHNLASVVGSPDSG